MSYDSDLLARQLSRLKNVYHSAIAQRNHRDVIRSSAVINNLHEYVVQELVNFEVPRHWIETDRSTGTLNGFFKPKSQDILIRNQKDEPLLSINVRSQLSSIRKNFDTIFERYVAESVNLHVKYPELVCGYLVLFPTYGYDDQKLKEGIIERNESLPWEKYIKCFNLIAGRESAEEPVYEYESFCLLVTDFSKDPPIVLLNNDDFVSYGLISREFANEFNFENLNPQRFFDDLIRVLKQRHGNSVFK